MWPGNYDINKTQDALSKTLNITVYDGNKLICCLRIFLDGYFFGTINELLILPEYQKQGSGSRLLQIAKGKTRLCYILIYSRELKLLIKRMVVGEAYSLTS